MTTAATIKYPHFTIRNDPSRRTIKIKYDPINEKYLSQSNHEQIFEKYNHPYKKKTYRPHPHAFYSRTNLIKF